VVSPPLNLAFYHKSRLVKVQLVYFATKGALYKENHTTVAKP